MKKNIQWFIDRIGKTIYATSPKGYNGYLQVKDAEHAAHLCHVTQDYQNYVYTEDTQKKDDTVRATELLTAVKALPSYQYLFTVGEKGSIDHLLKTLSIFK